MSTPNHWFLGLLLWFSDIFLLELPLAGVAFTWNWCTVLVNSSGKKQLAPGIGSMGPL